VAGKKLNPIAETANIQLFLQSCVQLGVPRSALFDVYDLYARRNMAQVLFRKKDDCHIYLNLFLLIVSLFFSSRSSRLWKL
jgi:hypothetical protein